MTIVNYLNAPAGAGKTYQMVRHVARRVRLGQKFLIVLPTNQMTDDIEAGILACDPSVPVKKFYNEIVDGSVTRAVYGHLNSTIDVGHVTIITAPCFELLNHINRADELHLIIDEVFSVYKMEDPSLPNNHKIFTGSVERYHTTSNSEYSILIPRDETRLRSLADNVNHDAVDAIYQPFARLVLSKDYQVWVHDENYESLIAGRTGTKKLLLFVVKKPSVVTRFASCMIMAADFLETMLCKIWSGMGVDFVEVEGELRDNLLINEHDNGHLVRFYYGYDENWSKSLKDSKENTLTESFVDAALKLLDGRPCLLLRNRECWKTRHLTKRNEFIQLPGKSHGQNHFDHVDNVLVLASFNPQLPDQKFLQQRFGIDKNSVKQSVMTYEIYQAVMRCSLRDRSSQSDKTIIVVDRVTAESLSRLFPGSSVHSLGLPQPVTTPRGRKAIHASPAEKQRVSRAKLKAERVGFYKEVKLATDEELRRLYIGEERDEYTLYSLGNNVSNFRGTIIQDIRNKDSRKRVLSSDEGPFISKLRERFKTRLTNKEDNEAISPAFFRAVPGLDSVTAGANVWFANGVWLDLDKTDLKPIELSKILHDIRFVAYSTFSHTSESLRYRVWIPTSEVMFSYQYRNVIKQIIKKVEEATGYVSKRDPAKPFTKVHGIEPKYDPSNKFYLPCKPADGGPGFLKVFDGEDRFPLDIDHWLETSAIQIEEPTAPVSSVFWDYGNVDSLAHLIHEGSGSVVASVA